MHAGRAGLQQDIGKAAGGGADIEADVAGDVDREMAQRACELESAAAHVGRAREYFDGAIVVDGLPGLAAFCPLSAPLRP